MKGRLSAVAAIVAIAAATGFLFAPLLHSFFGGPPRHLGPEVAESQWPDLVYLCGSLHDVELPMWNPYQRGGYPYYADPRAGTFNPVSWAICGVGGAAPAYVWAEAKIVLGFFLAGLFALLWLRRYGLPWGAALLGAVAFETAPYMRESWELGQSAAFAYLPFILWAMERVFHERRLRDAVALALAVGLCTWSGSPEGLFAALAFAFLFAVFRLIEIAREEGRETAGSALRSLLVAAVVGGGLTAAVVVPAVRLVGQTVPHGVSSPASAGELDAGRMLGAIWPTDGSGVYLGLLLIALVPFALVGSRWSRSTNDVPCALPGRWLHLPVTLIATGAAFGLLAPLVGLVPEALFGLPLHRLPLHAQAWIGPALGALAAAGLGWLTTDGVVAFLRRWKRIPLIALSVALATGGALWEVYETGHGPSTALFGLGLVGLASALPVVGGGNILVGCLLSGLLLFDLAPQLPRDRGTEEGPAPIEMDTERVILGRVPETDVAFAYVDARTHALSSGMRHQRRDLAGDRDPMRLRAVEEIWSSLAASPRILEQFGARYVITDWTAEPTPEEGDEPAGAAEEAEEASGDGGAPAPEVQGDESAAPEGEAEGMDGADGAGDNAPGTEDAEEEALPLQPMATRPIIFPSTEALLAIEGAVDLGSGIVELPAPMPAAYWISMGRTEKASNLAEATRRIAAEAPTKISLVQNPNAAAERLIAAGDAGAVSDDIPRFVPAEDFRLGRDWVELGVDAPDLGFVVVNGAWHPGWVGSVAGVELETYQINGLARGIVVDVGSHSVRMQFRPADGVYLRWALLGSLGLSLLILLGAAVRRS